MNDEKGSVRVEDRNGNNMHMDGAGTITVSSKKDMVFKCGDDASIMLSKDGTISISGKNINIAAKEQAVIIGGNAGLTANGKSD